MLVTDGVHCRQSADTGPVVGGVYNIGEKPGVILNTWIGRHGGTPRQR